MEKIFRKVLVSERLPEINKFVATIDEAGDMRMFKRTESGWALQDFPETNYTKGNYDPVYWLEEVPSQAPLLIEALKKIADPIKYLSDEAKREGREFNGQMAVHYSESAYSLKGIAKEVLKQLGL